MTTPEAPVREKPRTKGVYLIPSLLTSMGLFAGFYSLIAAIQGRFELAAWALVAATIFDMLDGRMARWLKAETAFGAEFDSLSDMLSFGVAPAVLAYLWALVQLPIHRLAWLGAFAIAAAAALRLARFNVRLDVADKRYFEGLPTPAAAMLIATSVLFFEDLGRSLNPWVALAAAFLLAWLMVSHVRFLSGKESDFMRRYPPAAAAVVVFALALVVADPYRVPFAIALAYVLHGPLWSLWCWRERRRAKAKEQAPERKDEASPRA